MIHTKDLKPIEDSAETLDSEQEVMMLKAKVTTLEQLLAVQEETAMGQSDKLEQTLAELAQKSQELAEAKALLKEDQPQTPNRLHNRNRPQGFLYDPEKSTLHSWMPASSKPAKLPQTTMPISIRGKTVGEIAIEETGENPLSEQEEELLENVVLQVAGALETAQLLEQIEERAVQLGTVADVSRAASTILDPDEMLQQVVDLTKDSFGLYHAHIYLMEKGKLTLRAGAGTVGREMVEQGRTIDLDNQRSLVARAARTRNGVLVNDVTRAPDVLRNPLLPDTHSGLSVPLLVGDELLGVLNVQADYINAFSQEDILIHTSLAAQVAVALQNARLYSETRRRADRERLVNEISQKIQNAVTVESALQTAVEELGKAFRAKNTVITLAPERELVADTAPLNHLPFTDAEKLALEKEQEN